MTKTAKKPRKLTPKQRKWLRIYVESGNATQAAIEAYNLDPEKQYDSARTIGHENITKLNFSIEELMDIAGITDTLLAQKLFDNLNATKLYGKEGITHADYPSRNKALEIALKLKGKLVDRVDHTTKGKKLPTPIYGGKSAGNKE